MSASPPCRGPDLVGLIAAYCGLLPRARLSGAYCGLLPRARPPRPFRDASLADALRPAAVSCRRQGKPAGTAGARLFASGQGAARVRARGPDNPVPRAPLERRASIRSIRLRGSDRGRVRVWLRMSRGGNASVRDLVAAPRPCLQPPLSKDTASASLSHCRLSPLRARSPLTNPREGVQLSSEPPNRGPVPP